MPPADWERLGTDGAVILDVREPEEISRGAIPRAINIPLSQLRRRFGELPRDAVLQVVCGVGQRGYYATRFLRQNGYDARNLSGGYATYTARKASGA
jgi:rhodanese-related sulfurtransferase